MRAVIAERHGGPEVLTVGRRPVRNPDRGELLVELTAAGVNFKDVYERQGTTPLKAPLVPGSEGAGVVLAVGADVAGVRPGDRVAWCQVPGSYAEQVLVPASAAVPVPDDIGDQDAAAIMLQGLTAHYLTTSTYDADKGEYALVHAAAGGLGQHLVRLLAGRGVRVIAAVSTPEKAAVTRAAGAHEVVIGAWNSENGAERAAQVRELTDGRGVDVVYDGVGRDTFDAGLAALRPRGVFVLLGAASGPVPPLDPQSLASRGSLYLTRPTLVHHATDPAELAARAGDVFAWLRDGTLSTAIAGRYPFEEASRAHEALQSRTTTGKLLLLP
ncbi:quinone oxidoreductase [Streptomyces sp. NPDC048420]|uniref:quinone oxidoreductase family protein n=1 Tax=Streptomyces sp. NPDC048420 TaxID=3155755 RepID=UPI00342FDE61